jgi:hypothetical protein
VFYREQFPKLKTKDIALAGKNIGKTWQLLSAAEQAIYKKKTEKRF